MWEHSDQVKDHVLRPRNVGVLADANAVGEVGGIACGDALKLLLKIDRATGLITDARFQAFGCGPTIAAASAITEMVTGKTVDAALRITAADIAEFIGGLPPDKMHCSVMGYEVLQAAIAKYHGRVERGDRADADLVCRCFTVDAGMIERAVRMNRLTTPEQVTRHTKAVGGCLGCFGEIEQVLARVNAEMARDGLIPQTQAYRVGTVDARSLRTNPRANGTGLRRPRAIAGNGAELGKLNGGAPRGPPAATPPAALRQRPAAPAMDAGGAGKRATPETITLIGKAIADLRPYLQRDGGDCELVDVDGNTVFVKLSGACVGCQMAAVTISGVQERLALKLGLPLRVVPVQ